MEIKEDYNIQPLNTFGINVDAKYFTEVASIPELKAAVEFADQKNLTILILGGGSNLLFIRDFDGLIIKINFRGIELIKEDSNFVYVKASAGENWDDFVNYCCEAGYDGLENLSLIPGNVGASPIQNIGAYGVELKDHFEELDFYDCATKEVNTIKKSACDFGYRSSIFKKKLKNNGVILTVTFKLNKIPIFKTEYGAIKEEFERMGVVNVTAKDIRNAVIQIRESKLPDPAEIGNAGSFFKNPVILKEKFNELKKQFNNLVSFEQDDGTYKLAAGWLIDQCGWKGFRKGDAGVHAKQALVIVNYGNAPGKEIIELANEIADSVFVKFDVKLEKEVNII